MQEPPNEPITHQPDFPDVQDSSLPRSLLSSLLLHLVTKRLRASFRSHALSIYITQRRGISVHTRCRAEVPLYFELSEANYMSYRRRSSMSGQKKRCVAVCPCTSSPCGRFFRLPGLRYAFRCPQRCTVNVHRTTLSKCYRTRSVSIFTEPQRPPLAVFYRRSERSCQR